MANSTRLNKHVHFCIYSQDVYMDGFFGRVY